MVKTSKSEEKLIKNREPYLVLVLWPFRFIKPCKYLFFFSFKISNKSKKQVFLGGGGVLVLILLHHVIKRFVQRINEKCIVELHVPVPITINQLQNERLSSWCMGVCIGMQGSAQNQMRVPTQQAQHTNKIGSL